MRFAREIMLKRQDENRKRCYTVFQMRILAFMVSLAVLVIPVLAARVSAPPSSPYADTESVTNVTFRTGVPGNNVFALSLELDASASNNVEVAFGYDANSDGTLDDSEAAFTVGWDCGEWFFRDIEADIADSCAGACGRKKLDWSLRLGPTSAPSRLRARAGGVSLPFVMTETMYDPSWNVARVTVRGFEDVEAFIRFGSATEPLVIRLR